MVATCKEFITVVIPKKASNEFEVTRKCVQISSLYIEWSYSVQNFFL